MEAPEFLTPRRRVAALAVAAIAVALGLTLRTVSARHEITGQASSCTIAENIDCDRVQSSEYARVSGVSVSVWGAAGFFVLFLWLLLAGPARPGLLKLAGLLAGFLLVVSLAYAAIAFFVLETTCLYCSAMHVCALALGALVLPPAWRARKEPLDPGAGGLAAVPAAVVVLLAVFGDHWAADRARLLRFFARPPDVAMRADLADSMTLGDPSTPISVLVYFDFGCPNCQKCYRLATKLVRRWPDDVHFLFKHWPLDRACNDELEGTQHAGACRAARAGAAAALRGKSEEALEYLFGIAPSFLPARLKALGSRLGLSPAEWAAAVADPRVGAVVARDVAEGNTLRMNAVPRVYVNGRYVASPFTLESLVDRLRRG